MPTSPKPAIVLEQEKRSHRTKKELAARKKAEAALLTGENIKERKEVRSDAVAHKEFLRLKKLLGQIEKDDAITENVINRYCQLVAECSHYVQQREIFYYGIKQLQQQMDDQGSDLKPSEYYKLLNNLEGQIIALDKQLMQKRKMLLDIEKESLMTIAAGLRAIPKKEPEPAELDPMAALLVGGPRAAYLRCTEDG